MTASDQFGEDVVISGVSGRLPESDNIAEFKSHLVNKEDMITADDRRWPPGWLRKQCYVIVIWYTKAMYPSTEVM